MPWNRSSALSLLIVMSSALAVRAEQGLTPLYRKKFSMGTVFEILAYDVSPTRASSAIADALAEVDRLDRLLSSYRSDSALSRLNRSAHFRSETVPSDLYRVIEESRTYS
jgi:thiamine biosynthesis lipoprotein